MDRNEIKNHIHLGCGADLFSFLWIYQICVCVWKQEDGFYEGLMEQVLGFLGLLKVVYFQHSSINTLIFLLSFVWLLDLLPLPTNLPSANAHADKWNANKWYAMGTWWGKRTEGLLQAITNGSPQVPSYL